MANDTMIDPLDEQMTGLNIPSEEITPVDNYDAMTVTGEEEENVIIGASGDTEDNLDDRPSDHPGVRMASLLKSNPLFLKYSPAGVSALILFCPKKPEVALTNALFSFKSVFLSTSVV